MAPYSFPFCPLHLPVADGPFSHRGVGWHAHGGPPALRRGACGVSYGGVVLAREAERHSARCRGARDYCLIQSAVGLMTQLVAWISAQGCTGVNLEAEPVSKSTCSSYFFFCQHKPCCLKKRSNDLSFPFLKYPFNPFFLSNMQM